MAHKKQTQDKNLRIIQLLTMAWNAKSVSRIISITDQILELNPDCIEALLLKADNIEDTDERIKILLHALSAVDEPENLINPDEKDLFFMVLNHRLAYTYLLRENFDEAFKYCEQALNFVAEQEEDIELDDEIGGVVTQLKALHYRVLLRRKNWREILAQTMKDGDKTLAWVYSRLIAAWTTAAPDRRKSMCASMFWDALMLAPDVPFYILGLFEEPDDDADEEVLNDFEFALMFYDAFSISDEFHDWFSRGTILFGLLSGRFENEEYDYMVDALDNLGGYLEYQRMRSLLTSTEDSEVIETLAANKCLAE